MDLETSIGIFNGLELKDFRHHDEEEYYYFDLILAGSLKEGKEENLQGDIYLVRCTPECNGYLGGKDFCYGFFVGKDEAVKFDKKNGLFSIDKQEYPLLLEAKIYVYEQSDLTGFLEFQKIGSANLLRNDFGKCLLRFFKSEPREEYVREVRLLNG